MFLGQINGMQKRFALGVTRVALPRKSFSHPFNQILASRIRRPQSQGFQMGSARSVSKTIQDYLKSPMVTKAFVPQSKEVPEEKTLNLEPRQTGDVRDLAEFKSAVKEMSDKYQVPEKFIVEVIRAESAFKPNAKSHAGALGLMQLMPGTAKDMGVENAFDIRENIEGGVKYLRKMLDIFGQDKRLALAAYNAGPGAVKRYGGVPPYQETTNYVAKIMKNYQKVL